MYADAEHAVLTVDLRAIRANLAVVRGLVAPRTEVAAVVKSDAYGLGLEAVVDTLVAAGCGTFFVAGVSEALSLRRAHPRIRIVVLQADPFDVAARYWDAKLMPVVNCDADLDRLVELGAHFPYLLKVDTGFSRFGATPERVAAIARAGFFAQYPPCLLMSHLACGDHQDDPTNRLQRQRFEGLRALLPGVPASLAASAGVWLGAEFHYDLVRVGSALYGLNNAGILPNPLRSTVRLHGRILGVRMVPAGEVVGYAAAFRTGRDSRIAIVGIGYAHGLPWSAANRIRALCGDIACAVVGRISMEYCALDVTDVPWAESLAGSWVEILGDDSGLDDLAGQIGINAQELAVRLGSGCQRRYRDEFGDRSMQHRRRAPMRAMPSAESMQAGR